jgi:hypothetical protein
MAFPEIDWHRPWLRCLRELGEPLAARHDWIGAAGVLASGHGLMNLNGQAVSFLPQEALPADTGYEAHIAATAQIPTRDNLHDFFNALVWLHFPQTKCVLNALHASALQLPAALGTRGAQRDAATLFDENAALVISDDPSWLHALREHDWTAVLLKDAAGFRQHADVILFGHALIEKLVTPYKSITAHVWTIEVESSWFEHTAEQRIANLDARLALELSPGFTSARFCHLPVLGVPGWWPGQDMAFYADTEVFRPRRK